MGEKISKICIDFTLLDSDDNWSFCDVSGSTGTTRGGIFCAWSKDSTVSAAAESKITAATILLGVISISMPIRIKCHK